MTTVGVAMVDTELAWELADAARGHLDARERNKVYIGIAVGDAFWANTFLLQTIVRAGLAVRSGLVPKLLRWVAAYDDHPERAHLRHLIGVHVARRHAAHCAGPCRCRCPTTP